MQSHTTASVLANVRTYFKVNQHHNAEKLLRAALTDTPTDAELHFWLGKAYYHQNKFGEALVEFNASIDHNPLHAEALVGLLMTYCDLGRYDEASELSIKLQRRPDPVTKLPALVASKLSDHHRQTGDLYVKVGKINSAIREYQQALAVDKKAHDCRLQLAVSCYFPHDTAKSLLEINTILAQQPEHFEALLWSGICYLYLHDSDRAYQQWEKAHVIAPHDPRLQALRRMNR